MNLHQYNQTIFEAIVLQYVPLVLLLKAFTISMCLVIQHLSIEHSQHTLASRMILTGDRAETGNSAQISLSLISPKPIMLIAIVLYDIGEFPSISY